MKRSYRLAFTILAMLFAAVLAVSAQQTGTQQTAAQGTQPGQSGGGFGATLNLQLGAQTFNEPGPSGVGTVPVTWQSLGLQPDLSLGKFGLGLDVTLHYRFTGGFDIYGNPTSQEVQIRTEDWVPSPFTFSNFLALYLPKIAYFRYAHREDPLYVKLGSIDDSTLGNGFIVGGYSNTLFLPETRIFGLNFNMDGSLFKFPYVGVQTFTSNVTPVYNLPNIGDIPAFDILGAALYARPLLGLDVPIIKNLQLSGVVAADRTPSTAVAVYGADAMVPILSNPVLSLASLASVAFENQHPGGMVGVAGRLIKFITYGAQIRFLGDNFIPDYFGPNYDLYRAQQYAVINGTLPSPASVGWLASAGFSALSDKLVFNVSLDGPFHSAPPNSTNITDYPHLSAVFQLAQGVIPGLYFNASYDKELIKSFGDLISAQNAVIGAAINYKTGPAVITLTYDLKYDPSAPNGWTINSGLSSSLSLF